MKTFIVLTFGFLGFAFYEMSGGSEFEPASARMAAAATVSPDAADVAKAPVAPLAVAPAAEVNTAQITSTDTPASVTRVALNLTTVADAAVAQPPISDPAPTAAILDSTQTPQIILPSLIATTNSSDQIQIDRDIRTVSGNRVNVRGGPSTSYGIVSKLTRGEEVRILEDNGDGWVRMQPVEGGESGWMADFLLTSG